MPRLTELATGPEESTFKMQMYTAGRGEKNPPEPIPQNSTFLVDECGRKGKLLQCPATLRKHMWAYIS